MKKFKQIVMVFLCTFLYSHAQKELKIAENSFQISTLENEKFTAFIKKYLENSQFIMVGEQHGIKEVGIFTNTLYNIGQDFDYKTLCIETDEIAAKKIENIAKQNNSIALAKQLNTEFAYAIPFYNNEDDYDLFKNVTAKGGTIWGIDQTFMVQFRLNFDYLIETTANKTLQKKLKTLKNDAAEAFKDAVTNKKYNANYIFKYNEATHKELMALAQKEETKEVLKQLWKTKEIYSYNRDKKYYQNNNVRGQLMKDNFIRYYKNAQQTDKFPKVIFKLGAFHAAKGLTNTNIFDISNLVSELAIFNGKKSVHFAVLGINGTAATGNPFVPNPVVSFNNTKQLPEEISEFISKITEKYFVLNLEPLRADAQKEGYSEAFKKLIFGYDVLVLVKDAEAFKSF